MVAAGCSLDAPLRGEGRRRSPNRSTSRRVGDGGGAPQDRRAGRGRPSARRVEQDPVPASARRIGNRLIPVDRAIWNDPKFQASVRRELHRRDRTSSRGVTIDEREAMLEILDLISNDELDEAAEVIRDNLDDGSSAVFDFTLANIYFQQDRLHAGRPPLPASRSSKHPKFRRAWANLGQIYFRQEDYDGRDRSVHARRRVRRDERGHVRAARRLPHQESRIRSRPSRRSATR